MNCRRVNLLLGVYTQLDRAERRMVDAHLRDCDACRHAWHDELRVRAVLGRIADGAPSAGFEARLRAIATAAPAPPVAGPIGRLATRFSLLVAVAVGGGLLVGLGQGGAPTPRRPMASGDQVAGTVAMPARGGPAGSPETVPDPRDRQSEVIERRSRVDLAGAAPVPAKLAPALPARRPAVDPLPAIRAVAAGNAASRVAPWPLDPPEPPPAAPPVPAAGSASRGGDRPVPDQPAATPGRPGGQATATVPIVPTPTALTEITAQVFVDLMGDGSLADCPGCDGVWTPQDEARAAQLGVTLPIGLHLAVYDADGEARDEVRIGDSDTGIPPPPMVNVVLPKLSNAWPLTVELRGLSEGWTICPATSAQVQRVDATGPAQLRFALTRGCPVATPSATPSATSPLAPTDKPTALPAGIGELTPTLPATEIVPEETAIAPAATPTPAIATAIHVDPSPTVPPAATPSVPPSPAPPTLVAIRWRPTPTATPTARPARDRPDPGVPKTSEPPGAPPWPTPTPTPTLVGEAKPRVDRRP